MNESAGKTAAPPPPKEDSAKRKRKPSGGFECKLGILLGVGGLIGSRLGQLWIAFDVFSQFTLQFAVMTLAFVIGLMMPRARLLAAFVVLLAGALAIGIWPHVASRSPLPAAAPAAGESALTVATFNTWYSNQQVDAVRDEILRLDADVIALQEVGPNKHEMLRQLRARYPHQAECFEVDYCNLVILSKLPLTDVRAEVSWEGPPYLMAKLGPEAGSLTVMAIHTIRFPHSRAQFRQVRALAAMVEAMPGRKLIMGDFNATPFSRIIETLERQASLARLTLLPSWPSHLNLPQIAIDHIFVSAGIRALSHQLIGQPSGSDHFPVMTRIAIPSSP